MTEEKSISVVRLTRSAWKDEHGNITIQIKLRPQKRKSSGYQILQEDCEMGGVEETIDRIVNLYQSESGVYEIVTCDEKRDWESGYVDDYKYKLLKCTPTTA